MTRRGRSVLALSVLVYAAAWAFGSKPLFPVAFGLAAACALAWLWLRLAGDELQSWRRIGPQEAVDGDDVSVTVEVEPRGAVAPPTAVLVESVGRLGEQRHTLRRFGRRLRIEYVLPRVPRGRYELQDSRVELSDPFGLRQVTVPLPAPGALLVLPRVVTLGRLFTESGAHALHGRRLLLRRPAGFDVHSVREHEHGESLRRVHWPSTARRGQLMVKDLEDSLRDEIAVVLDAAAGAVAGESFEVQVRAAASIVDVYARSGRRAVLVANAEERQVRRIRSEAGERRRALELLATVEPTGHLPLASLLLEDANPAVRALELVLVTARVEPALVDRLAQRALSRRRASLVYVDLPTFAGAAPTRQPGLLRLQAAGVSVAVVRAGDDLRDCLEGAPLAEAARA